MGRYAQGLWSPSPRAGARQGCLAKVLQAQGIPPTASAAESSHSPPRHLHVGVSVYICVPEERESHVALVGLKLTMYPEMILKSLELQVWITTSARKLESWIQCVDFIGPFPDSWLQ